MEVLNTLGISYRREPLLRINISGAGFDKYPAKQHARDVAQHMGISKGLIYLPGQHPLLIEDSDMTYPFEQRRYFYYMSGVNESDCYMTHDIEEDLSTLYLADIVPEKVVWFGRGSDIKEARNRYDFDSIEYSTSLIDDLKAWTLKNPDDSIYCLHPSQILHRLSHDLSNPRYDTSTLLPAMNASRAIKDPYEIALIRKAISISSLAHRTVMHHITSLTSEAQVHALFLDTCISHGAKLQAYPPIAASGTNASILHYSKNDESLQDRGLICFDAGCEWSCYASDITRTFPLTANGWPNKETADLYALVEEMQEECIRRLGPGIRYLDLFQLSREIAAKGLIKLGLFTVPDDPESIKSLLSSGAINAFFPHGLGHHMGLDVHDVSAEPILSTSFPQPMLQQRPSTINPESSVPQIPPPLLSPIRHTAFTANSLLQPGMVITVEPGLYFNRYALDHLYLKSPSLRDILNMDVLEKFVKVGGVRIEDDVLITKDGYENLTDTPKGREMLEIIREGARCRHGGGCSFGR